MQNRCFCQSCIFRPVLKKAWRADEKFFILDCHIENLEEILKQAQQIGLMTHEHHYIITNLDMHTVELNPYQYSETNITGVSIKKAISCLIIFKEFVCLV